MITIDDIKVNIRDFRDKLVRRTLTMGMIVKALDNIEKNFEEYAYLTDKSFQEEIDNKNKEVQRLTDIIIGYKQGDENKVKEWTQVDDEGRPHD